MKKNSLLILLLLCGWNLAAQTANPNQYKYVFTVAKDGSGDYVNIQDAIDAMRVYPLAPITLYIKNGTYREKIELPAPNTDVCFIGENVDSTILVFDDYSGKGKHTTFTSYTAKISGNRFRAANISFVNSAGPVGQALALYVDADKAVFTNCKFLGHQDTIFSGGEAASQLFDHCYIEGTTDFIFGPGTAVFNACTIRGKSNSFITAASTPKSKKYGFVFLDCKIMADSVVTKLSLGRPWRSHARTVFIRCELPPVITAAGWDNWGNPENEKTVLFAEYKNKGAGTNMRVNWSKQLTDKEAAAYTVKNIFGTDETTFIKSAATAFTHSAFNKHKTETVALYAGAVPNNKQTTDRETAVTRDQVTRIASVQTPTLTIYRPDKPNGQAVVICPGGGYSILAFDKEGTRVAEEFIKWGITAVVLKSRLPDDSLQYERHLAPLQDAQEAIRYVRRHAKEWGVHQNKIGIMGFSAGGHLASTAATHFTFKADPANTDTISARPDFAILIYPVISFDSSITHKGSRNNLVGSNATEERIRFFSNELQVNAQTPPSFLVHAGDDGAVPVDNSIRYYTACIKNKVAAELHLYPKGGHGFGLQNKTTNDNWPERLRNWLQLIK